MIRQPLDALGVNYYSPSRIGGRAPAGERTGAQWALGQRPRSRRRRHPPWPGTDLAWSVPQPGPYTEMGWRIEPQAFTDLLLRVNRDYPETPIMVTENGAAFADRSTKTGECSTRPDRLPARAPGRRTRCDRRRGGHPCLLPVVLPRQLRVVAGYAKRFGLVRVDYDTLVRTPKTSATWFSEVSRRTPSGVD